MRGARDRESIVVDRRCRQKDQRDAEDEAHDGTYPASHLAVLTLRTKNFRVRVFFLGLRMAQG